MTAVHRAKEDRFGFAIRFEAPLPVSKTPTLHRRDKIFFFLDSDR